MNKLLVVIVLFIISLFGCGSNDDTSNNNESPPDDVIRTSNLFNPATTIPISSDPEAVEIGDVNNDGKNDIVLITYFSNDNSNDFKMFVFLQNVNGELEPYLTYSTNGTYVNYPSSIAIGDINNDGENEIALGHRNGAIEIFKQNQSGDFISINTIATIDSYQIKIAHLNNDNLLDIVGLGWGTNTISVFLQDQNGSLLSPVSYSVTHEGFDDLEVKDLNNDGLNDIIVMSGNGLVPNFGILYQQTVGFSIPVYYSIGNNELTHALAAGDINNDGLNDIVATYGGNPPNSSIAMFPQNHNATLDPYSRLDSTDVPGSISVADLNGDSKQDIVVLHDVVIETVLYDNTSTYVQETYSIPLTQTINPQAMAVGDINNDGFPDVAIASDNGLTLLYQD